MNTYYETFLRKDIFPNNSKDVDLVIKVYDEDETERHYISMVLEDYIQGGSRYQVIKRLKNNIVDKYKRINECYAYLENEFKEKMK